MGFAFVASATAQPDTTGQTSVTCGSSLNVAEGDLLVGFFMTEANSGYPLTSIQKDSGSPANTFTISSIYRANQASYNITVESAYKIAASADATATFKATFANSDYPTLIVMQFRPDGGETVSLDIGAVGNGNGSSVATASMNTTGTDEVAVAGYYLSNVGSSSSEQIASSAATGQVRLSVQSATSWYRLLTGTISGTATLTAPVSGNDWAAVMLGFKSVAAAGRNPVAMGFGLS